MKHLPDDKKWALDPNNPPLFALATQEIDGYLTTDIREAAIKYARLLATSLKNTYSSCQMNDVLTVKIICKLSEILTPYNRINSNNLHSYRLRGIDLVGLVADMLSVSVKQHASSELVHKDNEFKLVRRESGIQIINKALASSTEAQKQIQSRMELLNYLEQYGRLPLKYSPPLSIFKRLFMNGLRIHVPLSLNYSSKLPIIYKEIAITLPTTQQALDDCILLLSKKELLKNSFTMFESTDIDVDKYVSENTLNPPLFYISMSACGKYSKVGFQESCSTKRPFKGGTSKVAIFQLRRDLSQAGIFFESTIKQRLYENGFLKIKNNSDLYSYSYNFLLIKILSIIDGEEKLSRMVDKIRVTHCFQVREYLESQQSFEVLS